MPPRNVSKTTFDIAVKLGQFLVLALCFMSIYFIYLSKVYPEKLAKATYQKTVCSLINKKLENKGLAIHRYRADFFISYAVNGVLYKRWISGNGLDRSYSQNQADQEDILSQYEVGGTYTCWYDPDSPTNVLLVFRHNWYSVFYLIAIPILMTLFCLYLLSSPLVYQLKAPKLFIRRKRRRKNE